MGAVKGGFQHILLIKRDDKLRRACLGAASEGKVNAFQGGGFSFVDGFDGGAVEPSRMSVLAGGGDA